MRARSEAWAAIKQNSPQPEEERELHSKFLAQWFRCSVLTGKVNHSLEVITFSNYYNISCEVHVQRDARIQRQQCAIAPRMPAE